MGRGSLAPAAVTQIQTVSFLPLAYEFKKATKDPSNTHAYPVHTLEAGLALSRLACPEQLMQNCNSKGLSPLSWL